MTARFVLLGVLIASAAQAQTASITIPRVAQAPKLEAFLNGDRRGGEAHVTGFLQREPGDGVPVSRETTAYLAYDDRHIHVIFDCRDERGKVRAHMSKREDLGEDDRVAVYLDTFRDGHTAYVFTANPLGVQADSIHTEGRSADARFDTLWHSEGRLTETGYLVLISIPFKSMRFAGTEFQTWGIALERRITRNNERAFWPAITRRRNNFVQQMARMEGLQRISPGRNIQIIPYGTFVNSRLLDGATAGFATQRDFRAGMDSKVVLRDSLTLDVTLNPDFSQVESDDPQVTVNQRYEVRFPEKRPFFIENAAYFETPISLFFSRRVADPEFGARLTGKLGRWSLGALAADDRAPGERLPGSDPLSGKRAVFGVARVQRELGRESRIGALATSYDFGPASNRVVSVDTRLKLSPTWFFTGQMARSYDRRRDGRTRSGPAYSAELARSGRNLTYSGSYSDFSPDFRSTPGFIRRVDVRQAGQYLGYYWWPENSKVLNLGPSISGGANWDRAGTLQDWYTNADFAVDFTGPTGFRLTRYDAYERYLDRGFRYRRSSASFYTGWLTWLYLYGTWGQGTGVNYNPAAGLEPFLAATADASFGFTARLSPRLRVEQFYYYSRLNMPGGAGGSVYNNHLARTKVNYQFTRAFSVRAILDYYTLLPDSSLIAQDKSKQLTGDVLFTWLLHPGTAFYFGYNRRAENVALEPGALRYGVAPLRFTGHQFFVKLSYLFRF